MKEFIEKLIERLEELKTFKINLADAMSELMKKDKLDNYISKEEVIEIVNQLAEEYNNGWIPCSERLPEPGKRYLVTAVWKDGDFKKHSVYDAVYGKDGLWHTYNYERVSYEVIAWQPLPPAFKGKGE